jgi:Phosphodiester glycosidase
MRIHRKVGRFRAVTAAVVLAIGALAIPSSAVPASTRSAVARDTQQAPVEAGCTPAFPNVVPNWQQTFSQRGVTLCQGNGADGVDDAYVQIIDLNAGAKIRLASDPCEACGIADPFNPRFTDLKYNKRTAPEWFTWVKDNVDLPGPDRLFSTSNGSFFRGSSGNTVPEQISLPEMHNVVNLPDGAQSVWTWGWAFDTCPENPEPFCHVDPGWNNGPKKAIHFGDTTATKQNVQILDFPRHYEDGNVQALFFGVLGDELRIKGDATVGYTTEANSATDRRTFVGTDLARNTVYILNTSEQFNNFDTSQILASFGGSGNQIQLDGGGSTQLAVDANLDGIPGTVVESDDIFGERTVPDTLAVYLAPS